jgi:hypothetical protein
MYRTLVWGLVLLVPLPAAWAQEEKKADDKGMEIKGKLSPDDPKDKVQAKSPHKVHTMKWKAGETYQIDLVSRAFDAFLRLEDSAEKELAQDDDSGGMLNARIVFAVPKADTYRIIATSLDGKAGDYTLTVRAASKGAAAFASVQAAFQKNMAGLRQKYAQSKEQDEKDKVESKFYEDAARFVEHFAKVARDYPGDAAAASAMRLAQECVMTAGEGSSPAAAKILGNLAKKSADKPFQGPAAISFGRVLRNQYEKAFQKKDPKAPALYQEAEKTLTEMSKEYSDDSALARKFKDALFELKHLTVGKPAMEIEGEDLDGKKFKLSDYRGKVVVLDFWGNW